MPLPAGKGGQANTKGRSNEYIHWSVGVECARERIACVDRPIENEISFYYSSVALDSSIRGKARVVPK